MDKSGLEELESLKFDWKIGHHMVCMISMTCDQDVISDKKFFHPAKKIKECFDALNPFTLSSALGFLR